MTQGPIIVWFRQVMRLADHPALLAAVATGHAIVPVYILDDEAAGQWRLGGARCWWLHHSIAALDRALRARGSRLLLRRGSTVDHLRDLAKQLEASAVYATRSLEPWARILEREVQAALAADGVELKRFPGASLFDPDDVRSKAGRPFGLYAPFRRSIADRDVPAPRPAPGTIRSLAHLPGGDKLERWQLLPRAPDWAGGLRKAWVPGEEAAAAQLDSFLQNGIEAYHELRDRPDLEGTSRLSPYLANGELSLRTCWHAACVRESGMGVEAFLRELAWREYSCHLLFHWPAIPEEPFRSEYSAFPWNDNCGALPAWQHGRTGYPMVDAGMRQLWHTGWMHNRVRMITASFLVKDLLVPWQAGEAWFWDTLVDADLASNAVNWQWVAGSGADAAPYFRIFNPVKQGQTYDLHGDYIRRWLPELAKLPAAHIHAPWLAPDAELAKAGVVLGETYPAPIVEHAAARARALAAFGQLRAAS